MENLKGSWHFVPVEERSALMIPLPRHRAVCASLREDHGITRLGVHTSNVLVPIHPLKMKTIRQA